MPEAVEPVGRRGYSWPPFPKQHGAFARDACDEAAATVSELLDEADLERFPAAALLLGELWVRYRRARADIDERGELLEDGSPHPLLRWETQWRRQLLDLLARFGLDPKAEAELTKVRAEARAQVIDLEAVKVRGREALDARARALGGGS